MPLLIVLALMALPFAEIGLMIAIGGWIGVPWTIALLFAVSASGVLVLRRAGTKTFRDADAAMRTGTPPQGSLLDTLMMLVGGVLMAIPGFITGAVGAVLALPFTRPLLRWAFVAMAERRMRRMGATVYGTVPPGAGGPGFGGGAGPGSAGPGAGPSGPAGGQGSGSGSDAGERPGRGKVIQGKVIPPQGGSAA